MSAGIVRPAANVHPHKPPDSSPTEEALETTFTHALERSVANRASDRYAPEEGSGASDNELEEPPGIELIPTGSVATLVDASQFQASTGRQGTSADRSTSRRDHPTATAMQSAVGSIDREKALDAVAIDDHHAEINEASSEGHTASTSAPTEKFDRTTTRRTLVAESDGQLASANAMPRSLAEKINPVALVTDRVSVTGEGIKSVELSMVSALTQPDTNPTTSALFGAVRYETATEAPKFDIRTPASSPNWPRDLEHIVRIIVNEKISEAAIRLNPPQLGPIDVALKVEGDSMSISFHASAAETRGLLEAHLPNLREALDAAGLQLADASITGGGAQRDSRGTHGAQIFRKALLIGLSDDSGSIAGGVLAPGFPRTDRLIDTFA